jgi:hypothetical protein
MVVEIELRTHGIVSAQRWEAPDSGEISISKENEFT